MCYTTHYIGTSHPMYKHEIHLVSDKSERLAVDTSTQVLVLQGIKPIAHFYGTYAKLNAKELIKILNAKAFFNKVA